MFINSLILCFLIQSAYSIYDPSNYQQNAKKQSQGVKTVKWQPTEQKVVMHHNYSKITVHGQEKIDDEDQLQITHGQEQNQLENLGLGFGWDMEGQFQTEDDGFGQITIGQEEDFSQKQGSFEELIPSATKPLPTPPKYRVTTTTTFEEIQSHNQNSQVNNNNNNFGGRGGQGGFKPTYSQSKPRYDNERIEQFPGQKTINREEHFQITNSQQQTTQQQFPVKPNPQNAYHGQYKRVFITPQQQKQQQREPKRIIIRQQPQYVTVQAYNKCPSGFTGQLVYELSCNQFLNCWNGRGVVQNCAPGTLFNPQTLECDYADKVECISGPRKANYQAVPPSGGKIEQATCPPGFTGLIPHYTNCAKFINCNNGQKHEQDCPPGTLFDVKTNTCNFAHLCQCVFSKETPLQQQYQHQGAHDKYQQTGNKYPISNAGGYGNQNVRGHYIVREHVGINDHLGGGFSSGSQHTHGYQKPRQIVFNEMTSQQIQQVLNTYCVGKSGMCPHPIDCSKYVQCINNKPNIQQCGPGTLYNHVTNTCDFETNVDCHAAKRAVFGGVQTGGQTHTHHHHHHQPGYTVGQQTGGHFHQFEGSYQPGYGQQNGGHSHQIGGSYKPGLGQQTGGHSHQIGGSYQPGVGHQTGVHSHQNGGSYQPGVGQQTGGHSHQIGGSYQPGYGQQSGGHSHQTGYGQQTGGHSHQIGQTHQPGYGQHTHQIVQTQHQSGGQTHQFGQPGYNQQTGQTYQPGLGQTHQTGYSHQTGQTPQTGYSHQTGQTHQTGYSHQTGQTINTHQISQIDHSYCIGKSGLCPHPTDCSKYVQCVNGKANVQECGPGTLFNHISKVCDFESKVNCQASKQAATSYTKLSQNKNVEVACPQHESGLFPHPYDCSKFLNCANGQTFIQDCGPGTHFNPISKVCDFPYNVKCENNGHQTSSSQTGKSWQQQGSSGQSGGQTGIYSYGYEGPTTPAYSWKPTNNNNQHISSTTVKTYDDFDEKTIINIPARPNNNNYGQYTTPKAIPPNPWKPVINNQINNHNRNPKNEDTLIGSESQTHTIYGNKNNEGSFVSQSQTKVWPPPFPSTDLNADYVFEDYDDSIEVQDLKPQKFDKTKCTKESFKCGPNECIPPSMVCNTVKDCKNGIDETSCAKYLDYFALSAGCRLAIVEEKKLTNVTLATCAKYCYETKVFKCKAFNYRKLDGSCFMLTTNIGQSGGLMYMNTYDYFELKSQSVDCSNKYMCSDKKCIDTNKVCDGNNDCIDRADEKYCSAQKIGYKLQMAGSRDKNEGRLEVTVFGKTGYVCDDKFGLRNAEVACRELGFPLGAVEVKGNSFFTKDMHENDTLYLMDDITCLGNETSLKDCDFNGWGVSNCMDHEIVGVVCKTPQDTCQKDYWQCKNNECIPMAFVCDGVEDCKDKSDEDSGTCDVPIQLRLVGGKSHNEGRVEIKYHNTWGTVCDDDFNDDAAKVVCKYLGFQGKAKVVKDGQFGSGTGPIWLDQVFCKGNESSLESCSHWNWGEHNCEHTEDVGVICGLTEMPGSQRNINDQDLEDYNEIDDYDLETEPPISRRMYPERCGLTSDAIFDENDNVHFRVVKGTAAKRGQYPWQASIRVKGKSKPHHWCGAVIISQKFVITAAHCLTGFSKGSFTIVAGDYDVDEDEGTEQEAFIEEHYIHDSFRKGGKMNNDIALVKLKGRGFVLTKDIQAICLPPSDIKYERNMNCTISGFGSTQTGKSSASHVLRAGWVPIQDDAICKMPHVYGQAITEGMICAGHLDEGVDACDGDSGGPLACLYQGYYTLYGLTSWGQHCGYANKPGVYVKVAHYRDWIDSTIKRHLS